MYQRGDSVGDVAEKVRGRQSERARFRTEDFLAFFKVTSLGEESSLMIDSDDLIDRLSISAAMGKAKDKAKDKEIEAAPSVNAFTDC